MNVLITINLVVFFSPVIYAFLATWPDGNMWSENGPGAVLWFYIILMPVCAIIQIILLVLKILFYQKSKK